MHQYFFDTSALVKRYHAEPGSARVREVFSEPTNTIRVSALGVVETLSAFAIKVRSGQISRIAAQVPTNALHADLVSGRIVPYQVNGWHFENAQNLVRRFGYDHRLRALDAIQLSVAMDLRSRGQAASLVTADVVMEKWQVWLGCLRPFFKRAAPFGLT